MASLRHHSACVHKIMEHADDVSTFFGLNLRDSPGYVHIQFDR